MVINVAMDQCHNILVIQVFVKNCTLLSFLWLAKGEINASITWLPQQSAAWLRKSIIVCMNTGINFRNIVGKVEHSRTWCHMWEYVGKMVISTCWYPSMNGKSGKRSTERQDLENIVTNMIYRSLRAFWAPTSSRRPFGPLDFVLRAPRPCTPSTDDGIVC